MKRLGFLTVAASAAFCLAAAAPSAHAQVSIGVQVGQPPECPYGYFDYPPYDCAPFGYYGPQWFQGGVFLGAGPWYRGPDDFDGWVNRHYDPRYGYRGSLPRRGEHPDWDRHRGWERSFRGDDDHHEHRHDNGNYEGQDRDRRDNGNHYGQERDRRDNGNGYREQNGRSRDNSGSYDQQGARRDNGNGYSQQNDRGHDKARDNGHDDNHHHDDDDRH